VVERRQRSARRRAMSVVAALASVALFVSLFGLAVFHTYLVENQRDLDRLDTRISAADAQTEQLRLQYAELEAPDRIMQVATDKLGMVVPQQVVTLPPVGGDR
jgi:cell division protein FtsL